MNATFRRPRALFALVIFAAIALFPLAMSWGQEVDPFSDQFKRAEAPKLPDPKDVAENKDPAPTGKFLKKLMEFVELKASVSPKQAKRGETITVRISGKTNGGAHTYSATKKHDTQIGKPSEIKVVGQGLRTLYPLAETNLHRNAYKKDNVNPSEFISFEFEGEFAWTQEVLVADDAALGTHLIDVQAKLMACTNGEKGMCTPFLAYPLAPIAFDVVEGALVSKVEIDPSRFSPRAIEVDRDMSGLAPAVRGSVQPNDGATKTKSGVDLNDLRSLLSAAFLGAFLMLLTPCVFPMIPITVNFFIKQSEKEHHRPLRMASMYALTIIVSLSSVMLLIGSVVAQLAINPWFNLALGSVLIIFALSLFGMYEIELPHFLSRFTSSREGQGGLLGTIFMALTFTITSFTCTGPFLGLMLTPVAGLKPPFVNLLLASIVYSTTFAAPFFLLAVFPSVLKKLPKSGGWMNVVKVTMGFLELGAALKFLAIFDQVINRNDPKLFNYDTVLCAWIALSLATALYLFNIYRLPQDDTTGHIGVLRMVFGTIFLGMAFYMTPLLFGITPRGIVMEFIVSFLPADSGERQGLGGRESSHLVWHQDYQDAWKEAKETNKLIFIDFTGVTCQNCIANERNVFVRKEVREQLEKYVRLQLFTDSLKNSKLSKLEHDAQVERHKRWQEQIADPTLPSYVVWDPNRNQPFDGDKLAGKVIAETNGYISDVPGFLQFLKAPLETRVAWKETYGDGWREAKASNKKMLLVFTNCVNANSQHNLRLLESPSLAPHMQKFVPVRLDTVCSFLKDVSKEEQKAAIEVHNRWLTQFVDGRFPALIVFDPDGERVLDDADFPKGRTILTRHGAFQDEDQLVAWLEKAI